jgi:hypothetical protein
MKRADTLSLLILIVLLFFYDYLTKTDPPIGTADILGSGYSEPRSKYDTSWDEEAK